MASKSPQDPPLRAGDLARGPCGGDAWEPLRLSLSVRSLGVVATAVSTPEDGCPGCFKSELNGGKCAGACPGELFITFVGRPGEELRDA